MPTAEDFKLELHRMMLGAMKEGRVFAEVSAGELHRRVGDYPGSNHRMPVCCQVMRAALALDAGDVIKAEPPSGQGASLTIRYVLPRPQEMQA
jgi:5-methylcytosine-specific restriction protein A